DQVGKELCAAHVNRALTKFFLSFLAFIYFLGGPPPFALAEPGNVDPTQTTDWAPGAIDHAQKMRKFKDANQATQTTPQTIPKLEVDADPSGSVATFQPGGATNTNSNAFFRDLGTNGRTCFTCHQPQDGWTISASSARARFDASAGQDPLFRLVDGATCPSDNVSTLDAKRKAYSLLIDKALIRIGIP